MDVKRPTSVTVIGWIFVGFGAVTALGGLFGMVMSFFMPFPDAELDQARREMPTPFRLMSYMFDYFWLMAAVQLAIAALMISGGVALLRLRSWGRTTVEVLTWLSLAYIVVFGVFWVWAVASMQEGARDASGPGAAFFTVFIIFGVGMMIAFAIPHVVIIRVLRGPTVRAAVSTHSV